MSTSAARRRYFWEGFASAFNLAGASTGAAVRAYMAPELQVPVVRRGSVERVPPLGVRAEAAENAETADRRAWRKDCQAAFDDLAHAAAYERETVPRRAASSGSAAEEAKSVVERAEQARQLLSRLRRLKARAGRADVVRVALRRGVLTVVDMKVEPLSAPSAVSIQYRDLEPLLGLETQELTVALGYLESLIQARAGLATLGIRAVDSSTESASQDPIEGQDPVEFLYERG